MMEVNFEELTARDQVIADFIRSEVTSLGQEQINWRQKEGKWSVLEVLAHLNQVYKLYFPKLDQALANAPELGSGQSNRRKTTWIGNLSVYSQKPVRQKRRFKMTTFDFFQPMAGRSSLDGTMAEYLDNKSRFSAFITACKTKKVDDIKVSTALGEKIRFYLPQCLSFLLAHEERHIVQIRHILESQQLLSEG